eukprot:s300_g16.t1
MPAMAPLTRRKSVALPMALLVMACVMMPFLGWRGEQLRLDPDPKRDYSLKPCSLREEFQHAASIFGEYPKQFEFEELAANALCNVSCQKHQGVANWALGSDPPMMNMLTASANTFADGQRNFRHLWMAADYVHEPKWTTIVWAELERSTEGSGGVCERARAIVV